MAVQIVIKNSSAEDKRPTAPQLANGEIALNYNAAGSFLTCKDTDGNIQQVGGVKISEVAPESPVKQTLWFQPSSLKLFVYDGDSYLPIAGGDGGGGTPGGGITTIVGDFGIDASTTEGVATLIVDLAGGDDGLEFDVGRLKASIASDSQLGSVKIGDGIDVDANGTISVDMPETLVFKGSVDLNNPPTGQIEEPVSLGDTYVNSATANPVDNGWTGIGGDVSQAGDLVVWDGNEWEIIATGGTPDVDLGYIAAPNNGIVTNTAGDDADIPIAVAADSNATPPTDGFAGLFTGAEKEKLAGIEDGATNEGTNDGRYLRTDDQAGDQTVQSTGTTTFDGLTEHGGGVKVTGGDAGTVDTGIYAVEGDRLYLVQNGIEYVSIGWAVDQETPNNIQVGDKTQLSTTLPNMTNVQFIYTGTGHGNQVFSNVQSVLNSDNGFTKEPTSLFVAQTLVTQTAVDAFICGYNSEFNKDQVPNGQVFNYYTYGDAPNFFKGDTYIGGDLNVVGANIELLSDGTIIAAEDAVINGVTVGIGTGSLKTNTAVGANALSANTVGQNNTAIGRETLFGNTEGDCNTANGVFALWSNTTGENNTAIGFKSLNLNTTGTSNTATGREALLSNTEGSNLAAYGLRALTFNTTGTENTAIGVNALYSNTTGSFNSAVGFQAGRFKVDNSAAEDLTNCSYLGYNSRATGSNQVQLGDSNSTTFAYGAVQDRSDARDKTDIRDTLLGLEFIKSLRPVDFRWDMRDDYFNMDSLVPVPKDGSRARTRFHHGLIAQEVKAAADAQGVDFAGYQDHSINGGLDVLSIGYTEMIAPLIKAVQELSAENAELKARLDDLEAAATS